MNESSSVLADPFFLYPIGVILIFAFGFLVHQFIINKISSLAISKRMRNLNLKYRLVLTPLLFISSGVSFGELFYLYIMNGDIFLEIIFPLTIFAFPILLAFLLVVFNFIILFLKKYRPIILNILGTMTLLHIVFLLIYREPTVNFFPNEIEINQIKKWLITFLMIANYFVFCQSQVKLFHQNNEDNLKEPLL